MSKKKCTACSNDIQAFDGVYLQLEKDYQLLCTRCYNDMMAEHLGVTFANTAFDPITLEDTDGINHTFHFRTRLIGDQVTINGIEILNDTQQGYEFSVLGDVEDELFDLFRLLFERIRRGLNKKHIEPDEITQFRITRQDTVRGYITSDVDSNTNDPVLVIDGKEILWGEFGVMLSTFEGFNFKLEIFDKTEEK